MTLIGAPLLVFGLLELGLRLAGFGYPTAFLLTSSNRGEKTFVQNNQFGWRFFGPRAARLPEPISIPRQKPPDTFRIFVFGESAAFGDPQPRFGLPRMLTAMLRLRHPDKKFEVVNAAMTAINSHVIVPLARDCEEAHADAWVLYMGNNEVVGPFGAGTVFGNQTTPLPLIRASIGFKATRTGQLLSQLRGGVWSQGAGGGEWEGMRAFVNYRLPASDARLNAVYENFEHNLKDIIAAGKNSGAKVVLSTVAVNLKECAPFVSLHRPDLSGSQSNDWQRLFEAGVRAQESGEFQQAITHFAQAERIDGSFAELRFRHGQCLLESKDAGAAQKQFAAARDLDALRFRCDSRINEIIRRQAAGDVALVDAEATLGAASPDGIPGSESFFEHVHFTFYGNYVLARAVVEKVEKTLGLPAGAEWPQPEACAQRLGYTLRDTQLAVSVMLGRFADVPFTFQANHDQQMRRLTGEARGLPPANSARALGDARATLEAAVALSPEDAVLWEQLGEIKQAEGDNPGAAAAAKRALELVPSSAACWLLNGILLAEQQRYEDALTSFKHAFTLDPQAVWARHNLALCLEKLGRRDEAIVELKRTLALKPNYGTAWLALGQLYEKMGRTNDAGQCFTSALTNRVNQADDLAALARFCASRRWLGPAVTNFTAAIELSPADPGLRLEAGRALSAMGRLEDAMQQYQAAVEMEPDHPQPHMQLGVTWGRLGNATLAEKEFRQVLRLDPESTEARVDLGVALYRQEKFDDALKQFDDVLQRNPRDATALHYVQLLRNRTPVPAAQ